MPYAKPREEETWRSEWIKAFNGTPVLLQTSSLGATVAIDGAIGVDDLMALYEKLDQSEREAEPRIRKMLAIDDLLGVYEGSSLAKRAFEQFENLVWLVDKSGLMDRME